MFLIKPRTATSERLSGLVSSQRAHTTKDGGQQRSVTEQQNNEHLSRPRELKGTRGRWSRHPCFGCGCAQRPALQSFCSCRDLTTPMLNTSTPFSHQERCPQPIYVPSYLQNCCQVNVVFVRPASMVLKYP